MRADSDKVRCLLWPSSDMVLLKKLGVEMFLVPDILRGLPLEKGGVSRILSSSSFCAIGDCELRGEGEISARCSCEYTCLIGVAVAVVFTGEEIAADFCMKEDSIDFSLERPGLV